MRALLDTQVFIWSNTLDRRLSRAARDVLDDGTNDIYLSAVTAWEIAIKYARGRLPLPEPPQEYVEKRLSIEALIPLPIDLPHALAVGDLPAIHNDPFDRLLIAQARVEQLPILTSDANIAKYDVQVIW